MDTSKSYVEMCGHARCLQDNWVPQSGDWCYISAYERFSPIVRIAYEQGVKWRDCVAEYVLPQDVRLYGIVWLPRQDQLVRLVYPLQMEPVSDEMFRHNRRQIHYFESYLDSTGSCSIEKLWLMFLMASRYSKYWKDGRWLKDQKLVDFV